MRKKKKPSGTKSRKNRHVDIVVDAEWRYKDTETKDEFRCASWKYAGKGKQLYGTFTVDALYDLIIKHRKDNVTFIGHNVYTDLMQCLKWGIPLPDQFTIRDSLLAMRFADPLLPTKELKKIGRMHGFVYKDLHDVEDPDVLLDYCGKDVVTSEKLVTIYEEMARAKGTYQQLKVYYDMQRAFMALEVAGLHIDRKGLLSDQREYVRKLTPLLKKIENPELLTNDRLLREWLHERYTVDELSVLPTSRKSKEQSISKDHLDLLPQTSELRTIAEARALSKFKTLYIDAPLKHANAHDFIFPSYMLLVAKTQRRSSRPNIQNWPTKPVNARKRIMSRYKDGYIVTHDYCVAPDSKILTEDLRWIDAQHIRKGDALIGFDEALGRSTKFNPTTVTKVKTLQRPCVRITMSNNQTLVCSIDHKWPVKEGRRNREWREAGSLRPGDSIAWLCNVWKPGGTHDHAYLAGFMDGEGYASKSALGFSQNPGKVLDHVVSTIERMGFKLTQAPSRNMMKCKAPRIIGGTSEELRFLGQVRPIRLIDTYVNKSIYGRRIWGKKTSTVIVEKIEDIGVQDVISITTTTGTLVVDGFLSHNCNLEARIFAWQANCPSFLQALIEGGYIKVAEECLGIKIESKSDPRYVDTKSTVLAVTYNMTPGLYAWRQYIQSGGKVRMTRKQAEEKYAILFNRWPELYEDMERRKKHAWDTATVLSDVGVPLPLPVIPDDLLFVADKNYYKKIENFSINWRTQQFAGYVTGCALIDIMRNVVGSSWGSYLSDVYDTTQGAEEGPSIIPMVEIHDALDCDTTKPEEAHELFHYYMTRGETLKTIAPNFPVEILDTEYSKGRYWDYVGDN